MTNPTGGPRIEKSVFELDTVQKGIAFTDEQKKEMFASGNVVGGLIWLYCTWTESDRGEVEKWLLYGDLGNKTREKGVSQIVVGGKMVGGGLFASGTVTFTDFALFGLLSAPAAGPFGYAIIGTGLLLIGAGMYNARRDLLDEGVPVDQLNMNAIAARMVLNIAAGLSQASLYSALGSFFAINMVSWTGSALQFSLDYTEHTILVFSQFSKGWKATATGDSDWVSISGSGHAMNTEHMSFLGGSKVGEPFSSLADWLNAPLETPAGKVQKGGFWIVTTVAMMGWAGKDIMGSIIDKEKDEDDSRKEVEMHEMRQQESIHEQRQNELKMEARDGA